jgi:tetraacyldisaccharide 4'-kinase
MKERLEGRVVFGVGRDRFGEGVRLEAASAVDVFILDDGFQHLQLARDVDIVLIDASREFRDEMLLPAGLLREPRSALARADAIVYTRMSQSPEAGGTIARIRGTRKYPLFTSETRLLGFRRNGSAGKRRTHEEIGEGPFFAFCGIGNPEAFFLDLKRWGLVIAGRRAFRDHHKYTAAEAGKIEDAARLSGAVAIVTTEKDSHNFVGSTFARMPVYICDISFDVIDEKEFFSIVVSKIGEHQGAMM